MKRRAWMITISVLAVLLCACIAPADMHAQELRAAIPFSFTVDGHTFNSGTYQFDFPYDSFTLAVHNVGTRKTVFLNVRPESDAPFTPHKDLTFRHDGNHYYLIGVYNSSSGNYSVPVLAGPPTGNRAISSILKASK